MKRTGLKANVFGVLSAVIGLLIFLHWLGALVVIETLFHKAVKPVNDFFYVPSNNKHNSKLSVSELEKIVTEKDTKIMQLEAELAKLKDVENDNKSLKSYFNLFESGKYDYIMSKVISRDVISRDSISNNKLIINRGTDDGIKVGLIAVNQEGIAVGKITKVKNQMSELSLLNSPDCRLAVSVLNSDQTVGLSQGELGLTVKMEFVPQSQTLEPNQSIVTSGLEPNVPSGILVGKIKSIDKSINEIWQDIILDPVADTNNLKWVAVILPKGIFIFE